LLFGAIRHISGLFCKEFSRTFQIVLNLSFVQGVVEVLGVLLVLFFVYFCFLFLLIFEAKGGKRWFPPFPFLLSDSAKMLCLEEPVLGLYF
jgi:hypothetical protein